MSTFAGSGLQPGVELPDRIRCFSKGRVNSAIVLGRRGTAVVDTQVTLDDGRELKQDAESLSGGRPILYVAITHEHFDHIAGNQFFQCEIVSSRKAAQEILAMMDSESGRELEAGLRLTLPTVTFEGSCEISLGDLTLEMRHYGGHCPGESIVYIPEIRTLVAGDLVFNGSHPYVGGADISRWISALTELYLLSPEFVIPGHGLPGTKRILAEQRAYLESFRDDVMDAKARGVPAEEAAREFCVSHGVPERRQDGFLRAVQRLYGL